MGLALACQVPDGRSNILTARTADRPLTYPRVSAAALLTHNVARIAGDGSGNSGGGALRREKGTSPSATAIVTTVVFLRATTSAPRPRSGRRGVAEHFSDGRPS